VPLHPDAGQRRYPLWNGWGYETAGAGGKNGIGTLFALDAGPPKPAPQPLSFTPRSTAIGKQVRIWGYNLFSAAVQFKRDRGDGGFQCRAQLRLGDCSGERYQRADPGHHSWRHEHGRGQLHSEPGVLTCFGEPSLTVAARFTLDFSRRTFQPVENEGSLARRGTAQQSRASRHRT